MSGPTRRSRAAGGRDRSVRVSFSEAEMALVMAAAARAGLSNASWLGDVGVAAARPEGASGPARTWGAAMQELMGLRAELAEVRRVLTNVGGNLNDVARHANSTGEVPETAARVMELVSRVVGRVEQAVVEADVLTAAARRERLRSGS